MLSRAQTVKTAIYMETSADCVVASKGTYKVRWGYFYTHGMTHGKQTADLVEKCPWVTVVSSHQHHGNWPKDSWFEVVVTVDDEAAAKVVASWAEKCNCTARMLWNECNGIHKGLH